jgi:predicted O-linked N-acetylglucosamine transferase (SPINDLY family)
MVSAEERDAARRRRFQRAPAEGRRLKLGYVSWDFRQHAVSYFVEQLFAHHDRARFEVFAYYTNKLRDEVTDRIEAQVEHWVPVAGLPDGALRDRIEADGIDVLVDLSGHTARNRLGAFARRAAPVQAHYLGYFASTGLTEMDYWIGDDIVTPAGDDSAFSESIWRLPRTWVSYGGKPDAPQPKVRRDDGAITIGSFTDLKKIRPESLALWSRILLRVPNARLLLKNRQLLDAANRRRVEEAMAAHGLPPDRLALQGSDVTPGWHDHMAYHDRLDIALDPVGVMTGSTTTCDALWMGVPVVTLMGDRMGSRMAASMLAGLGHPEWVARSADDYVGKVVALAADAEQRRRLRLSLRDEMSRSSLCDARGLARSLEDAYLGMFGRWRERGAP